MSITPEKVITICVGWDSGPYGTYSRYTGIAYGDKMAQVPEEVFARYERAETELNAAQDALEEAIQAGGAK